MKLTELLPTVLTRGRLRGIEEELRSLRNVREFYRDISASDMLGELDPQLVDAITQQLGWERLSYFERADDQARTYAVREARFRFRRDPLVRCAVKLNTYFGFGQNINVEPVDERAREPWTEFWTAKENRSVLGARNIHKASDILQQDGELFFACWVSTLTGSVRIRRVKTDQVTAIVVDPEDEDNLLYFLRSRMVNGVSEERYYSRWDASPDDLKRATLTRGIPVAEARATHVCMMHIPINTTDLRGWPVVSTSLRWGEHYDDFMQDRVSVAAARAMYVNKLKHQGGSRARDALIATIQSSLATGGTSETNPRAIAGSTWLENEAATLTQLSQNTGAQDATADGLMLVGQFGAGVQIPPFLLGRPDAAQNKATAEVTLMPTQRMWQQYALFWGSVWREMVDLVLTMKETYPKAQTLYDTHEAEVSTDAAIQAELGVVAPALVGAVPAGAFPAREAAWVLLNRPEFGLANPQEAFDRLYPPVRAAESKPSALREAMMLVLDLAAEAGRNGDEDGLQLAAEVIDDATP